MGIAEDEARKQAWYTTLLRKDLARSPDSARAVFYTGRALFHAPDAADRAEGAALLERRLAMSEFPEERFEARVTLTAPARAARNTAVLLDHAVRGLADAPFRPELLFWAAHALRTAHGAHFGVVTLLETALRFTAPPACAPPGATWTVEEWLAFVQRLLDAPAAWRAEARSRVDASQLFMQQSVVQWEIFELLAACGGWRLAFPRGSTWQRRGLACLKWLWRHGPVEACTRLAAMHVPELYGARMPPPGTPGVGSVTQHATPTPLSPQQQLPPQPPQPPQDARERSPKPEPTQAREPDPAAERLETATETMALEAEEERKAEEELEAEEELPAPWNCVARHVRTTKTTPLLLAVNSPALVAAARTYAKHPAGVLLVSQDTVKLSGAQALVWDTQHGADQEQAMQRACDALEEGAHVIVHLGDDADTQLSMEGNLHIVDVEGDWLVMQKGLGPAAV